jgi:hypothetical protein
MGTIPSLHTQISFKHKSNLGESFKTVSRDEEKDLRGNVDPRARELRMPPFAASLNRGGKWYTNENTGGA